MEDEDRSCPYGVYDHDGDGTCDGPLTDVCKWSKGTFTRLTMKISSGRVLGAWPSSPISFWSPPLPYQSMILQTDEVTVESQRLSSICASKTQGGRR